MARPREFETEKALQDLTDVFWRKGYDGTSLHDIETATGLHKQSLYRAFGDKKAMYLAALSAYEQTEVAAGALLLRQDGNAHERFGRMFHYVMDRAIEDGDWRGCFLCNASLDQGGVDPDITRAVQEMTLRIENVFEDALRESGYEAEDPPARRRMARKLLAGYFGFRVLTRTQVSVDVLSDAVEALLEDLRS